MSGETSTNELVRIRQVAQSTGLENLVKPQPQYRALGMKRFGLWLYKVVTGESYNPYRRYP